MRHIGAYVELAGLDLARTQREIMAQVVASAIVAIFFASDRTAGSVTRVSTTIFVSG